MKYCPRPRDDADSVCPDRHMLYYIVVDIFLMSRFGGLHASCFITLLMMQRPVRSMQSRVMVRPSHN